MDEILATHDEHRDGSHRVAFRALRVVIFADTDGMWSAQGLDLDYAACGESVSDVQGRFVQGLCETIQAHLERFGSLERMMKHPPAEVWQKLLPWPPEAEHYDLELVSLHDVPEQFPYTEVAFRLARAA
jgi:hypothetical protein